MNCFEQNDFGQNDSSQNDCKLNYFRPNIEITADKMTIKPNAC